MFYRTRLASMMLMVGVLTAGAAPAPLSMNDILKASPQGDWRGIDPANTLVMQLSSGSVVIELAPAFAPQSVANIKALVRAHYFPTAPRSSGHRTTTSCNGRAATTIRSVAQNRPLQPNSIAKSRRILPSTRYLIPILRTADGILSRISRARNPGEGRTWLTHC